VLLKINIYQKVFFLAVLRIWIRRIRTYVFGHPGSGSISQETQRYGSGSGSRSFYHQAKEVRKTSIPTGLTSYVFLSLKNDVNVPSKSNRQKKLDKKLFLITILKVTEENSRIRSRGRIR
jgi:hypothetical protein